MRQSRGPRSLFFSKFARRKEKSRSAPVPNPSHDSSSSGQYQPVGASASSATLSQAFSDPSVSKTNEAEVIVNPIPTLSTDDQLSEIRSPRPLSRHSVASSSRSVTQEVGDSLDLWDTAYQNLKDGEATAKLMEAYEKILTNNHTNKNESDILRLGEDAPNMLDCDRKQRMARMTEMTRLSLEKSKRHDNVHQAVKQAIDFVQMTSTVVSSMLAAYPPASIAWSGICAVLPILAIPSTQTLALRDGLFYVMEKMEWYMAISRLSLKFTPLADAAMLPLQALVTVRTTTLFQALLEYEAKAVCFLHGKSPLTRAISYIFSASWQSQLEDVKALETEIGHYMSQFNSTTTNSTLARISQDTSNLSQLLREMRNIREQGEEERQRQEITRRLELVAKFSTETTCPYLERMMAVPKRVEGTCEWFQTHRKYRDWLESPDGSLLLLSADPGCGKSVMSRFLVEEVLPSKMPPESTLCYFFFKDSPDQNNVPAALCALIHQILARKPEMTDRIRKDILENGSALTIKERVLWRIFDKIIAQHVGDIVCVLDALDECEKEGRMSLIEHIRALVEGNSSVDAKTGETPRGKIRLLITSRGYPEIMNHFDRFSRGCIRLAGENKDEVNQIQQEIAMVANYRLDRLAADRGFTGKKKEALRQCFQQKGGQQRTYLWVRLVFEVLESNLRDQLRVWQTIINTLPQTVYDAYDKLLENVREADRDRVMMMLRFMIAAFRPIPLQTAILLLNARDFADEETSDDAGMEEGEVEWESEKSFRSWVLQTCGIFVTIYDQQLFFIHQTAKEFLQESGKPLSSAKIPRELPYASTFRHSISEKEAHKAMAEACIALWKYGDKPVESWGKQERYRYPLELWAQHFREAQVFTTDQHDPNLVTCSDINDRFWDMYLALWEDRTFIRPQQLSQFLAAHDRDVYAAPALTHTVKLAFIASYGHYRLLEKELRRVGSMVSPDEMPFLLSASAFPSEFAKLLLRHLPIRPVVVLGEHI